MHASRRWGRLQRRRSAASGTSRSPCERKTLCTDLNHRVTGQLAMIISGLPLLIQCQLQQFHMCSLAPRLPRSCCRCRRISSSCQGGSFRSMTPASQIGHTCGLCSVVRRRVCTHECDGGGRWGGAVRCRGAAWNQCIAAAAAAAAASTPPLTLKNTRPRSSAYGTGP